MVPLPCEAPVGLVTWPWILPVGAAAGGACASTGTAANASRPSQSEMVRFILFSLEQRELCRRASSKYHIIVEPSRPGGEHDGRASQVRHRNGSTSACSWPESSSRRLPRPAFIPTRALVFEMRRFRFATHSEG